MDENVGKIYCLDRGNGCGCGCNDGCGNGCGC